MERVAPTVRQLINAVLGSIATHPRIINPEIYYPIVGADEQKEEVKIIKYRNYDGIELQEPGLVLDVFPYYSSRTFSSGLRAKSGGKSVAFKPMTLSHNSRNSNYQEATYNVVIQLNYQDVAINNTATYKYDVMSSTGSDFLQIPHGYNVRTREQNLMDLYGNKIVGVHNFNDPNLYQESINIEVDINPGEEILREYLDLLRLVVNDMPTLLPFSIRDGFVKEFDFPTTSWNRTSSDIYFHFAWLLVEFVVFPPGGWGNLKTIEEIIISD